MITPRTASVLPTTVSHCNTSVGNGTTLNSPEASDKPQDQPVVSRNLSGKTDKFLQPRGKTRGESLVGSVEVTKSKNSYLHGHGGQHGAPIGTSTKDITDRETDAAALADFTAAWEAIRFGTLADRAW